MIYLISNSRHLKIGIAENPVKRLAQLQTGSSEKLNLEACFRVYDDSVAEEKLHRFFDERNVFGEWFEINVIDVIVAIKQLDLLYQSEKQINLLLEKPCTKDKGFIRWLNARDFHEVNWWEVFDKPRPLRTRLHALKYMEELYPEYLEASKES